MIGEKDSTIINEPIVQASTGLLFDEDGNLNDDVYEDFSEFEWPERKNPVVVTKSSTDQRHFNDIVHLLRNEKESRLKFIYCTMHDAESDFIPIELFEKYYSKFRNSREAMCMNVAKAIQDGFGFSEDELMTAWWDYERKNKR
jgi:hypothetical protein